MLRLGLDLWFGTCLLCENYVLNGTFQSEANSGSTSAFGCVFRTELRQKMGKTPRF
jgi:hypothetical protein